MEPFRWRRAMFLGLVSYAASLSGLVCDTFVPVLLQAGHPLWHNDTGLHAPLVGQDRGMVTARAACNPLSQGIRGNDAPSQHRSHVRRCPVVNQRQRHASLPCWDITTVTARDRWFPAGSGGGQG